MGETLRHRHVYICVHVDLGAYIQMNNAARTRFGGLEEYMTVNTDQGERKFNPAQHVAGGSGSS